MRIKQAIAKSHRCVLTLNDTYNHSGARRSPKIIQQSETIELKKNKPTFSTE